MAEPRPNLFRESFLPVVAVIAGLFLLLVYAQFRAALDASRATVIEIRGGEGGPGAAGEDADARSEPELAERGSSDPRYREAARLMEAKQWDRAERVYQAILASVRDSEVLNDLGVLSYKRGDREKALSYFDRALKERPVIPAAYFNRGLVRAREGKLTEAVRDYEAFIALRPNHFEAHYNAGIALLRLREQAQAAAYLRKAAGLAAGERKARALTRLGAAYREMGPEFQEDARVAFRAAIRLRPNAFAPRLGLASLEPATPKGRKRAKDMIGQALDLNPSDPSAYFQGGLAYSALGERRAAEDAYRKAVQLSPEHLKARYNLGILLIAGKGDLQEARSQFEWVVKREPNHAEAFFNLGRIAYREKDHDGALREYRRALELRDGDYPEAQLNIGLVQVARKEYDGAAAAYRKAIRLRERYPEAWYNLGLAHLRKKDLREAERAFLRALGQKPAYAQAWFNLGVLYGRQGRDGKAIEAYRKALDIRPDYPAARLNLAVRYAKKERFADAVREYRTLLEQDKTYALAWMNLGLAYRNQGDRANAEEAFRQVLELQPRNGKARLFLGEMLMERGKPAAAVAVLERAVAAETGDAKLRYLLAQALERAGRKEDARVELEKALRLDPQNDTIRKALERTGAGH